MSMFESLTIERAVETLTGWWLTFADGVSVRIERVVIEVAPGGEKVVHKRFVIA